MVRSDLTDGLQAAQAVHAALAFSLTHPAITAEWFRTSNFLVVVAVPDEDDLYRLVTDARAKGIVALGVREPDLADTITAVALQPGPVAQRLCSSLPLALRRLAMT